VSVQVFYPTSVSGNNQGEWAHMIAILENKRGNSPEKYATSVMNRALRCHFVIEGITPGSKFISGHIAGVGTKDPVLEVHLIVNGNTVHEGKTALTEGHLQTVAIPWPDVELVNGDNVTVWLRQTEDNSSVSIGEVAIAVIPMGDAEPFPDSIQDSGITNFRSGIAMQSMVEVDHGAITLTWECEDDLTVHVYRKHGCGTVHVGTTSEKSFRDRIGSPGHYEYFLLIPGRGFHDQTATIDIHTVLNYAQNPNAPQ
jgi:hypothetical protein